MQREKKEDVISKASSPRNVVGDLPLTWSLSLSRHCGHGPAIQGRYKEKTTLLNRLDPGSMSGMTTTAKSAENSRLPAAPGMTTQKAFTLIELLVVVLIIGILAAVAVPQYQIAVEKARFANYRSLASAIGRATDIYYLANNTWPTNFEDIDVQLPAGFTLNDDKTCGTSTDLYCCYAVPQQNFSSGLINCGNETYSLNFTMKFASDNGTPSEMLWCRSNTEIGKKVCISLGGKNETTGEILTPSGYKETKIYEIN